jgi:hypothetical protein
MAIKQISEHVLRITEKDWDRIRFAFNQQQTIKQVKPPSGDLSKFLDVDDAEILFGSILEVYIEDPVRMLQFKFDWSA